MSVLYISLTASGNEQIVRRPCRTDAIGAALRGIYGSMVGLPPDMVGLIQRLDLTH